MIPVQVRFNKHERVVDLGGMPMRGWRSRMAVADGRARASHGSRGRKLHALVQEQDGDGQ